MIIEAYIGKLNDPSFDFFGGSHLGNIPMRISPILPNAPEILSRLWTMIRNGEENTRVLDWGAVGVIMSKQQIIDFLRSLYGEDEPIAILDFCGRLENDLVYVLVACETGEDYNE